MAKQTGNNLMTKLTILTLIFVSAAARADVQRAECVGPAGAPVKAIYLHGWFPPRGEGDLVKLEAGNRVKMRQLAEKLGIRIAIPIAPEIHKKNGNRQWPGSIVNAPSSLRAIEAQATRACGAPLAPGRTIIGFSNGGYEARNIAINCDAHLRQNYTNVIMMGANVRSDFARRDNSGCPKLTAMHGQGDGSLDRNFPQVAARMGALMSGAPIEIRSYRGAHDLADNDTLAGIIGRPSGGPAPGPVADRPAQPRPPARQPAPVITGGSTFMDDGDATR